MNEHHYAVIMAGGIGSRFWPMSRQNFPKQFLDILNTGQTLIQGTFERLSDFLPAKNIYVVTANEYVPIVKKQLPGMKEENILGEPSRKNTAPCIAYIAFKLVKQLFTFVVMKIFTAVRAAHHHHNKIFGIFINALVTHRRF